MKLLMISLSHFVEDIKEIYKWEEEEVISFQIRGSDFIFDPVQLMYYKYHKVKFRLGGSYMDFSDWIKNSNNKSVK